MRLAPTVQILAMVVGMAVSQLPALAGAGDVHFSRALQYQFGGNSEAAAAEYRRGLELDPMSVDGHAKLGVLLLEEQGDVDGAISELVTALSIDPQCTFCQMHLDDAVDRRNSTAKENINRGNDFYKTGNLGRAAAAYRVAIYVDPESAEGQNSLAWTLYRMGKLEEGTRYVNEALRLKPEDAEYINTLACILYDQGRVDQAIAMFRKAIAKSKKPNPADLYGLAIGFLSKGDSSQALQNFREAIKSDPNYKEAVYLRDRIGLSVHSLAYHDKLLGMLTEAEKADAPQDTAQP
jgi:tetratricopeptide (TPR) repeat protein